MKFGLWYDFRNPAQWRQPWPTVYGELLDQITWAESAGFDSVWLSEHHITDDGYMPSVFTMLAAISAQTTNLRLGTAVCLAPLHHPVRLAEDVAVVDVLSNGRVELGLAPGYRQAEFDLMDVPKSQRGLRTDETIEILRQAWTGRPFTHAGETFQLEDVVVQPTPVQGADLPIHIGGSSQAAANRAGAYHCNFLPDVGTGRELHDSYRAALVEAGRTPAEFEITINGCVYVSHDVEEAQRLVHRALEYMYERYMAWEVESGDAPAAASDPLDDSLLESLCIVGTPEQVADQLLELRTRLEPDRAIFWGRLPGIPIEDANRSLQLFADEVMPVLA